MPALAEEDPPTMAEEKHGQDAVFDDAWLEQVAREQLKQQLCKSARQQASGRRQSTTSPRSLTRARSSTLGGWAARRLPSVVNRRARSNSLDAGTGTDAAAVSNAPDHYRRSSNDEQLLAGKRNGASSGAIVPAWLLLTSLRLRGVTLTVLPELIVRFQNLETLDISMNSLRCLPSDIGQLSNLRVLFAHNNCLTELPSGIGCLRRLEYLALSENQLTKLPNQLFQCEQLITLLLEHNNLCQVPQWLALLPKLRQLKLAANPLPHLPWMYHRHNRMLSSSSISLEAMDYASSQYDAVPPCVPSLMTQAAVQVLIRVEEPRSLQHVPLDVIEFLGMARDSWCSFCEFRIPGPRLERQVIGRWRGMRLPMLQTICALCRMRELPEIPAFPLNGEVDLGHQP